MALRLYFDEDLSEPMEAEEISEGEPDKTKEAVQSGEDINEEVVLYLASDDTDLTYENISIEQHNNGDVDIEYAEDDNGNPDTYSDPLSLDDGDYSSAIKIHRKATVNDVTEAFRNESIRHRIIADEYVKG